MLKKFLLFLIASLQLYCVSANMLTRSGGQTTLKEFSNTLDDTLKILKKRPLNFSNFTPYIQMMLVPDDDKTLVIGDIHGDWETTKKILAKYISEKTLKLKKGYNLIVMGDFVDRMKYSIDVCNLLFQILINNPTHTFLIQGNHETKELCGQNQKNTLYGSMKAQAINENNRDWKTIFQKAINAFALLPQTVALCNPISYSFFLFAHAGLPGSNTESGPTPINLQSIFKRFISKASLYESHYCKIKNFLMHNWSNWTDWIASIPEKFKFLFPAKSGIYRPIRGCCASMLSHKFIKHYLTNVLSSPGKFTVDAFMCGHSHVKGGVARLKNKITNKDLEQDLNEICDEIKEIGQSSVNNLSELKKAILIDFMKTSWDPLPIDNKIDIAPGNVFTCLSSPRAVKQKGAPAYAIIGSDDYGKWNLTHKTVAN